MDLHHHGSIHPIPRGSEKGSKKGVPKGYPKVVDFGPPKITGFGPYFRPFSGSEPVKNMVQKRNKVQKP